MSVDDLVIGCAKEKLIGPIIVNQSIPNPMDDLISPPSFNEEL